MDDVVVCGVVDGEGEQWKGKGGPGKPEKSRIRGKKLLTITVIIIRGVQPPLCTVTTLTLLGESDLWSR